MVHDATACSSRSAGSKMTSLLNREPRAILATIGISRAAGRPVTYLGVAAGVVDDEHLQPCCRPWPPRAAISSSWLTARFAMAATSSRRVRVGRSFPVVFESLPWDPSKRYVRPSTASATPVRVSWPMSKLRLPTRLALAQLLNQPAAQTRVFLVGDRSRFLEFIKFLDLIRNAEADDAPNLILCLLCLLIGALRHPLGFDDHVSEHANVGKENQAYHPQSLARSRNVMTAEKVAEDDIQQPDQNDENEYREYAGQEVAKVYRPSLGIAILLFLLRRWGRDYGR